jgi:hypothetical protein
MTFLAQGACAFAWRNYLLRHSSISEDDDRRSALYRYITNLRETGGYDFDLLQIAAVAYLNNLDKLHDDQLRDSRQIGPKLKIAQCTSRHSAYAFNTRARERTA